MALVKMVRDFPEVKGGNMTADIPEEAVQSAMDNGWRVDGKTESVKTDSKPEPKEETKVETKVEEKKVDIKTETPKTKTSKREA